MPQEIGIGFVLVVIVCVILVASAIFISQDDFHKFMDRLADPIFRYFEKRRNAQWKTWKKQIAEEREKLRSTLRAGLDKQIVNLENLRASRQKVLELFEGFCIKIPDNMLSKKSNPINRGCFNIRNGYIFIVDDNGSEWIGVFNPSPLMGMLCRFYEKRALEIPIKGRGQKISGKPIMIDGSIIDVYPKWFSRLDWVMSSEPSAVETRSKWARLYRYLHSGDLTLSWEERFKTHCTPANQYTAQMFNQTLKYGESQIDQGEKKIKIWEAMESSLPDLDDPETFRMLKKLGDMTQSEKDALISKI